MPFLSTLTASLVSGTILSAEIQNTGPIIDSFELQRLQNVFPGVGTWNAPDGRLNRIFGRPMVTGGSPQDTAMNFIREWSGVWGLSQKDFILAGPFPGDDRTQQPLMWDQATGTYKFTSVYFKQNVQGVPVYNSRLQVLVRNDSGFPAVSIGTDLRNVNALLGEQKPAGIDRNLVNARAEDFLGSDFVMVSQPEMVVYAGYDFESVPATFAYAFDAKVGGPENVDTYQKARYIIDAASGELLRKENLILNCTHNERIASAIFASATAVDGVITGANTITSRAEACDPEVQVGAPYLAIPDSISGTIYTDYEGNATGVSPGSRTLTVDGRFFDVNYFSGSAYSQSVNIESGLPFNLALNPTDETGKAAMNAYIESNVVRDFSLARNPSYPVIGGQQDWDINIGVSGSCNAFYDGSSINFYNTGGGCNNTAFSVIVHHEYGHHLVNTGGSGQNEFGEGSGDVMGVLIERDSRLARGFFQNDCNNGIRNADNTCTFQSDCSSCGSTIHSCGQLISGCVWDTVAAFEDSGMSPDEANFYMGDLYLNMIPLHSGGSIQQDILIDILTLDDNDGNLNNGSPNYFEIAAGFAVHGFDAPELSGLDFQFPNGTPSAINPFDGVDLAMNVSGLSFQPVPNTGTLYIGRANGSVDAVAMPQVANNQYALTFSDIECDEAISYYFSSEATTGDVFYWPGGQTSAPAPTARFTGIGATGEIIAFDDDFQTDTGWTVSGAATDGQWDRGVPVGCDRGDPGIDADGSGSCFLTDNSTNGGDCNSDVDGGQTILTSPPLNASAPGSVISYWRWFDNSFGASPNQDTMLVQMSGDGGLSWVGVEVVGPVNEATGGWYQKEFLVSSYVANSTNFRIRFIAQDTDPGSVVEAAIDGVRLLATECIDDGPSCPGDVDDDSDVDFNDLVSLLAAWGDTCSGCPEDVNDSGTVNFDDLVALLASFGPCP